MTTIIDGTSGITFPEGNNQKGALTLGTVQNTTSGTYVDFTDIPSWVKRITVMFNGVSTNGTSLVGVQIGSSAGIETTSYVCTGAGWGSTNAVSATAFTTLFGVAAFTSATSTASGICILTLMGNNTWAEFGNTTRGGEVYQFTSSGSKTLSGTLDRIRITTVNGTDLFDAGSVNIMYE